MAILTEQRQDMQGGGAVKEIDEAGIHMVMDTLQKYQYSFPIKSTTREILCNGVDSVLEKKMAIEILTGKSQVADYYADIEGALYKDSKFNPDYYDLKWLNQKDDNVYMTYVCGPEMSKDQVIIKDNGVALGGKRLEGYFKLAYSTKRLSKIPIGKWGLGAKSPLSIGMPFYSMESTYNGRKYRFQIYDNTFYSIVPQYNLSTGTENEYVIFNQDNPDPSKHYKVYHEPTTEKNSVTVILDAKKHHKQQYIDAVKSQMLYFEGIVFKIREETGVETLINYKADILYEDDMIVMSNNNYFSKPHLLLNKVNYGYIDWSELELQDMQGNIGIKVQPEEVDVNPSRESVLWTEKTKEKVLKRFEEVVHIAGKMIQEELMETDFVKWIKTCYSISSRYSDRNGIVGRLAKIVDLSQIALKFSPHPEIVFSSAKPLNGVYTRYVYMQVSAKANNTHKAIRRDREEGFSSYLNTPFVLTKQNEKTSNRKDKYLLSLYPGGFVQVLEPYDTEEQMMDAGLGEIMIKYYEDSRVKPSIRRLKWDLLNQSKDPLIFQYGSIVVPDTFTGNDDEEEVEEPETEEEEEKIERARVSAEERRKLEGKTIVNTPFPESGSKALDHAGTQRERVFSFHKLEVPIRSINDWDAPEIYYGFDEDNELFQLVAALTRPSSMESTMARRNYASDWGIWEKSKWYRLHSQELYDLRLTNSYRAFSLLHFFDAEVMLVKVAQANARLYRDFPRLQEFFIKVKDNKITMSNTLIKWNTARLIKDKLAPAAFLFNFDGFNQEYAEMYRTLTEYVDRHYREVDAWSNKGLYGINRTTYDDLLSHLENVRKFQEFVAKGRPAEEIAKLAQEFFGNKDLRDGMAVDPQIIKIVEDVLEYVGSVGPLLNYVPVLTGYEDSPMGSNPYKPQECRVKVPVPETLELEVRLLLEHKGMLEYRSPFVLEQEVNQKVDELLQSGSDVETTDYVETEIAGDITDSMRDVA